VLRRVLGHRRSRGVVADHEAGERVVGGEARRTEQLFTLDARRHARHLVGRHRQAHPVHGDVIRSPGGVAGFGEQVVHDRELLRLREDDLARKWPTSESC
jgi:hypothetical protein